jgi:hypothetical protein
MPMSEGSEVTVFTGLTARMDATAEAKLGGAKPPITMAHEERLSLSCVRVRHGKAAPSP